MTTATMTQGQVMEAAPVASNGSKFNFKSAFIVTLVAIIAAMTQGYNMLQYPYFQDREGTNISNAWAMTEFNSLSPYTYDYEEAPVGSLILSAWVTVVGDIDAFGFSANTGRVLMLGVHVICVMLIYAITHKITNGNDVAAGVAALLFALSPLVTILQRRVLLENMMLMWLLAAIYSAVGAGRRLDHYLASAFFFAVAVLTRTSAIWFLPAFVYIIWQAGHRHHRRFAHSLWLTMAIALLSMFPLYAAMRLELFPQGWWFFSGDYPHVSLWERIIDRGPETGRFLDVASNLIPSFIQWTDTSNAGADPVLIFGGLICAIFVALMSVEATRLRGLVALMVAYVAFLFFGGRVVHSDVLAMLPLLAMSAGVFIGSGVMWVARHVPNVALKLLLATITLAAMVYPFAAFYGSATYVYESDQTSGQLEVIEWVKTYIPEDSVVVMDNYGFVEVREAFPNAHHYWKVDTDPDVRLIELDGNWCNIDYIVTSPQLLRDAETFELGLMSQAVENSNVLNTYENNGWPIEVRRVNKQFCDTSTNVTTSS